MALDIIPRLKNYTIPLKLILIGSTFGLLTIFDLIFRDLRPLDVFHFERWRSRMFQRFWLFWGPVSTKNDASAIEETAGRGHGVVIDVGPGSGQTLKYLNKSQITHVYGVEPCLDLHDALRSEIRKNGLEDIYTIVGCGIESMSTLSSQYNLKPGTVDSIVAVKVICGIPTPEDVLPSMYELLKPGGEMFVYEHVGSSDAVTTKVQWFYQFFWPWLFGGCNINRRTEALLRKAGDWAEVDLDKKKGEIGWEVIPHLQGRLVKGTR